MGAAYGSPFWREPEDMLMGRVAAFADWLSARPDAEIAVVGHGAVLRHLLGRPFGNAERLETTF